jgi:hypothetical protein
MAGRQGIIFVTLGYARGLRGNQRVSEFHSPVLEMFDIGPDQVRALDDRRLTDLCRCFAVIAENKRKVAAIVAEKP